MRYPAAPLSAPFLDRPRLTSIPVWGTAPTTVTPIACPVTVLREKLDALPTNQVELALRFAQEQLQAAGIRLYSQADGAIYHLGRQPRQLTDGRDRPVEQHLLWEQFLRSGHLPQAGDWDLSSDRTWVIANLACEFRLRTLAQAFDLAAIAHVMIVPLRHDAKLIGSLSLFRAPDQPPWDLDQVVLAQQFAAEFATALHQYQQVQVVHQLNQSLSQRQAELERLLTYQQVFAAVVTKIRSSIDLATIFHTTVHEIYQQFQVDRVVVYRFKPDWSGEFLAEAVGSQWLPLKTAQFEPGAAVLTQADHCVVNSFSADPTRDQDNYLQQHAGGAYAHWRFAKAVADIEQQNFPDCYLAVLKRYHCRAYIVAPVYQDNQLWGLLAAYQNSAPRQWQTTEISLMQQIAEQLSIAIQQAEQLRTSQGQAQELASALTELNRTQRQMLQTEKMTSVGQLTAGLTHAINNPVTFIHSNLEPLGQYVRDLLTAIGLYQQYYPEAHPSIQAYLEQIDCAFLQADLPKVLQSIENGTQRISDVMRSLKRFSYLDEEEIKAVDLHEGIDSVILILQHQCEAQADQPAIALEKDYGAIPAVECNASLINQVLVNLMSNAITALRSRTSLSAPRIQITTQVTELADAPAVSIQITDNGPGIPAPVQSRIFDPFFTTKDVGAASGPGLSISHHIIVDNHQGQLRCQSEVGAGTTFEIILPVQSQAVCALAVASNGVDGMADRPAMSAEELGLSFG